MAKITIQFNRFEDACRHVARGKDKPKYKIIIDMLRSAYRVTPDDQKILADLLAGKLSQRGRPEDLDAKEDLKRMAAAVERIKLNARAAGHRLKHAEAVEAIIEREGYSKKHIPAAIEQLTNFLNRSKRWRKSPQ